MRRTRYLEGMGYSVLRFWNNDVLKNIQSVLEVIQKHLVSDDMKPHPNPPLIGEKTKNSAA